MAEGMLGGILGDEKEKPEVEAPEALAGAEAFAAAIAAIASRQDPGVARKTEEFLSEQTQLLKVQKQHLEDEHALRLAHLRHELGEENIRRFGLRLRVGFQVFIALAATVIGIGAAIAIYDAVHSRSVVVDPFEIAPNITAQAPSGKIVAAGFLDALTQLQAATQTTAQKREISNAWTNEISTELPETGVSIGQIERLLKTRFGHDLHISGDLVKIDPAGLALTVRGAGVLPKTFSNEKSDLNSMLTKAAEYVYGESEPGLFAVYLAEVDRNDDAIEFAKSHLAKVNVDDQPLLLVAWGAAIFAKGGAHAVAEALPLWNEAVRIKPDVWGGNYWVMFALNALGDEEAAVQFGLKVIKLTGGRPGRVSEQDYSAYDADVYNVLANRAAALDDIARNSGVGTNTNALGSEVMYVTQLDAQLHEVDVARLRLKTAVSDPNSHSDIESDSWTHAFLAEEVGDLSAAAKYWDDVAAVHTDSVVANQNPAAVCWAAPTYEKTGQRAKADAALDAPMKVMGISTYVDCYRFRADVLDLRGDWAGAQAWYAKAVKLAPSIPSGYYSWGIALTKHGDVDGAAAKFQSANQKGQHWADPLKAWGDVLVRQDKIKDALVKYDEALKYAPNWKQLKEAREAAAKQKN